jgi:hypothetical protein
VRGRRGSIGAERLFPLVVVLVNGNGRGSHGNGRQAKQ